ncbi:hypothetical protein IF2G_05207 [Cordyceps javanica]|nr:hypothetical protein IF2G_05207 [Cordyceps javanica]
MLTAAQPKGTRLARPSSPHKTQCDKCLACVSGLTVLGCSGRDKVRVPSDWWYLFAVRPSFCYSANDAPLLHCLAAPVGVVSNLA